jgi:hypothetical protein
MSQFPYCLLITAGSLFSRLSGGLLGLLSGAGTYCAFDGARDVGGLSWWGFLFGRRIYCASDACISDFHDWRTFA